jgi:hypothetical protein
MLCRASNPKFINMIRVCKIMSTVLSANERIVSKYWKWFCGLPRPESPAVDNDGDKDEQQNNDRDFFFLSFVLSGGSHRICNVPLGKKVVIPSLSCLCSAAERPGSTVKDLENFADVDHDNIEYRRIEINGKPLVGDIERRFRIRTKPFEVTYPKDAIFNAKAGRSKAVADGVYVVWEPPFGEHIIHFEGKIDYPEKGESLEPRDYVENVTYTLKVK